LNLKAPTTSPNSASQSLQGGREKITIRPPKRPQTQRPTYLDIDLEDTQPPPGESVLSPPLFQANDEQLGVIQEPNTSPDTHEPAPNGHPPQQNPENRRNLWQQLWRLFQ